MNDTKTASWQNTFNAALTGLLAIDDNLGRPSMPQESRAEFAEELVDFAVIIADVAHRPDRF